MSRRRHDTLHGLVQRVAATAPGSWLLRRTLYLLDPIALKLSGGRATLAGLLAGIPVVMVTTTGARSGRRRTLPLLPVHDPRQAGRFALIASNFGEHHFPAWYYNLKKNPGVMCELDGHAEAYMAHEAQGAEYERFWQYANEIYFGYALYKQRAGRRIPIMVLERHGGSTA